MANNKRKALFRKGGRAVSIFGAALLFFLVTPGASLRAEEQALSEQQALHLLNRLGFGPRQGDVKRVQAMGAEAYIQQQLFPQSVPEQADLGRRLGALETLWMTPMELFREYGPMERLKGQKLDPEAQKEQRRKARVIVLQAMESRLMRAIESPHQLQEVMVDFWYNHFNVFVEKGLDHLWVGAFEEQAIRPYVLGRFRDLVGATAKHPAMLFYLDNWQNTAPGSSGAGRNKRMKGLNENYARELMELHTLGVDGGYTQKDVVVLARILTGWGIAGKRKAGSSTTGFYFDEERHDSSDKVFLGQGVRGRGQAEGEEALDILARSPATARHISYQLAQYFVSDQPAPELVNQLTQKFLQTDGDIRSVLEALFHSAEFRNPKNYGSKLKTPYHLVVSSVRASGVHVENFKPLAQTLRQMGMPLYGCLTPDGYKNTQEAWLSPDGLLHRLNFVTALAAGKLKLAGEDLESEPVEAKQLEAEWDGVLSDKTRKTEEAAPDRLRAAMVLGSPEFMRR